jgi:UDP-glucose:(heptosyl)LPS alpha-1,3-glucosyltransferase
MVRRDVCRRHDVPSDLVSVIYNGVDLERFHPRRKATQGATVRRSHGFEPHHFLVLFLGTGYGRKGLDLVLDAFPSFVAGCPQARLLIAGYDSAQPHFEDRAERLGLAERVAFAGGRRDTEAYFAAADLYALPTRYDPFASTTLEAMASGVPVITTTRNGAAEIIRHREHGSVLTVGGGAGELSSELLWWAQSGHAKAAAAAARSVAERHSVQATATATTSLLERVARARATDPLQRGNGA